MSILTSNPSARQRRRVCAALGLAAAVSFTAPAFAQASWPSHPITVIVGYPPGGGADIMARLVGQQMSIALGQQVIIDNRPGGAGQIAASTVHRAQPDGYTLLVDASAFAINPSLYPKLAYKPSSFETIGVIATLPLLVVLHPSFPAKSIAELVARAKASPASVFYATSGSGSLMNLAGAMFETQTGVKLTQVPYKGAGAALNDVVGGQVPLYFGNAAATMPFVKAGKLRPLGITGTSRTSELPEVPTLAEQRVAGMDVLEWNAMFAPAGTPQPIIDKLNNALRQALNAPEVLERLAALGARPFVGSRAKSASFVQTEITRLGGVVHEHRIAAE